MWAVLTSEYLWGVITGVVLTAIGTWLQSILTARQLQKAQRDLIKNFCIDTVNNIRAIVDNMANLQQRTQIIYADHTMQLDTELAVFGRNREQIIHLPNSVREDVRKFVNDCSIRRAEIGNHLTELTKIMELANQLQARGDTTGAQQARNQAQVPWGKASQALGQLANRVKDSTDLVNSLKNVR